MIIHASLKTDITYFYMPWFCNRLKEGYFDIRINDTNTINRYKFSDNPIEKIYLHTKNPYKIIKNYNVLKNYKYNYEVVTHLTMYDKFYETKISDKHKIFDYIRQVKSLIGKENNSLCYGPIFKTITNDMNWHIAQFKFLCRILHKYISTVYYDFSINTLCQNSIYLYGESFSDNEIMIMKKEFKKIADNYNLKLKNIPTIETFKYDEIDIGEENTCPAACKHCKFISNQKTSTIKSSMHSSISSLLIGNINSKDKITYIKLEKPKEITEETLYNNCNQFSLFDMLKI